MGLFFRRRYTVALPYDAEVEYLESTGSQYVNTGMAVLRDAVEKVQVQTRAFISSNSNNNTLICLYVEDSSKGFVLRYGTSTFLHYMWGASRTRPMIGGRFVTRNQVFDLNLTLNGAQANAHDWPLVLFCSLNSEMAPYRYSAGGRLYSLKVAVDDVVKVDLIPVRVGIVGYIFDKVSGRLFGNNGTGDFVVGPDINQGGVVTQYKSSIYVALGEERRAA